MNRRMNSYLANGRNKNSLDRQIDRQIDRETDRLTDRQIDRQTERYNPSKKMASLQQLENSQKLVSGDFVSVRDGHIVKYEILKICCPLIDESPRHINEVQPYGCIDCWNYECL